MHVRLISALAFALCAPAAAQNTVPITQLPSASLPLGLEDTPTVQSGSTKRAPAAAFGIPVAGTVAPTPLARYQLWVDTSAAPSVLKMYDGTSWVPIGTVDLIAHTWTPAPAPGVGLHLNSGSGELDALGQDQSLINGSASVVLNADQCGAKIYAYTGGDELITLPASPPAGCKFTAEMPTNGNLLVDAQNVGVSMPGYGNHSVDVVPLPLTNNKKGWVSWSFDGTNWNTGAHSTAWYEAAAPLDSPLLAHGQVYFNYDGGSSKFRLCPKNGPGGLIIDGQMHRIRSDCLTLPQTATTSSVPNYFYAVQLGSTAVSATADNGSGKVRLTVASMALSGMVANQQVALACHSIRGTVEANGFFRGTYIDSTHLDMPDVAYVHALTSSPTAACRVEFIIASTTGHANAAPWMNVPALEVKSGDLTFTYVGSASIGAANAVNSTQSWFHSEIDVTGALKSNGDTTYSQAACADLSNGATACVKPPSNVAGLGTCNSGAKGTRAFVTDANATTFLSTAAGGGSNNVPVVCDGTNWVIG